MPVMDGYEYADNCHAKTVIDSSFRYGCFNRILKTVDPVCVQDGWNDDGSRRMVDHTSEWLPVKCGHIMRGTDPACTSCINRIE